MSCRRAAARGRRRRRSSSRRHIAAGPASASIATSSAVSRCSSPPRSVLIEPIGLISVMPQAWMTSVPYRSMKARIIASGQAEPPITTRSRSGIASAGSVFEKIEQPEPQRRHRGRERHPLADDQLIERRAVELRSRQHELCSRHRGGEDQRPGIGMVHRHDRHHRVAAGQRQRIAATVHHRAQDRRAVRIDDALGIAGGPRSVADAAAAVRSSSLGQAKAGSPSASSVS